MNEDQRPNPETLLALIKKQDDKIKGGRLKIFFGMAAGVGKTFAMLQAARQRLQEGKDVISGVVLTHGRKETAALIENIPFIPLKKVQYKEASFEEMDLDEILNRKPDLVLVDELAHSNILGSRHPKRWQDVIEILDAGIDVYTTLNVQHVGSLKQVVEEISEIKVYETVPDVIFERAAEIALIDLTPEELLKRMKEGKVYLGDKPEIAVNHFFRLERLTALREIALRYVADRVDHDLKNFIVSEDVKDYRSISEHLMVAVSSSPHSEYLVRAARRISYTLRIPWMALYIDNGIVLNEVEKQSLSKNLSLARELGAEVVASSHPNLFEAIQKAIKQYQVTQIVMGRPGKWTFKEVWEGGTLLDHIARQNRGIDLYIIHQQLDFQLEKITSPFYAYFKFPQKLTYYWAALIFIGLLTFFNFLFLPLIGWKSAGFVYLLGILSLSLFTGKGPILFAALLSTVTFGLFFIVPARALYRLENQDFFFFIIYIFTAFITGILVSRVKHRETMLIEREQYTELLYSVEKEIAAAPLPQDLFKTITKHLEQVFKGDFGFALRKKANTLDLQITHFFHLDSKQMAVALWSMKKGKPAGWSTDTLPSIPSLFLPLKGIREVVGVMVFRPKNQTPMLPMQMNLLITLSQRIASYLERYLYDQEQQKNHYLNQTESLHQKIITIISDRFGEPLKIIRDAAYQLPAGEIKKEIEMAIESLHHTVANFNFMSGLQAEQLRLHKKPYALAVFIEDVLNGLQKAKERHLISLNIKKEVPLLCFDYELMSIAMTQLLNNAFIYSPEGSTVEVKGTLEQGKIVLSVSDQGPGIPDEEKDKIFEKFYQIPGINPSIGAGLGLALAKTIIELHEAQIEVGNNSKGGAVFKILFQMPSTNVPSL